MANADTFHIIENLHDESVREAILSQASITVAECQDKSDEKLSSCLENQVKPVLELNDSPIGWSVLFETTTEPETTTESKATTEPETTTESKATTGFLRIISKCLGYTVTALAIMMGAPFWFDLLKKLVNVRNAGPKPKSSSSSSETTTININTEK